MNLCNPKLSALITRKLNSTAWLKDLSLLSGLRPFATDEDVQAEWIAIKADNKVCRGCP